MIPGVSTGGGGLQASSGVKSSNELQQGGQIFNFGPPSSTGSGGVNYNLIAIAGFAALALYVVTR